jgi:two-component system, cell cycle sensor histidine kinase and response regulator CckA
MSGQFPLARTDPPASPPRPPDLAARETLPQFRELMAHLQQAFWIKNADDTAVLYVSPAYESIWGRTCASLCDNSHTFLDSVHAHDRERVAAAMARKHATEGYAEEYRIVRPDGATRWIWARTYPVRDALGVVKRYAGIAEDISERKWAEQERSRLAAIIEYTEDAIVSVTLDGIIIAWNNGAERKYGYAAEEVLGLSILILIPPDQAQEYLAVMKRARSGEPVPAYDTMRRHKDGTLISVSVGIAPIESRDGSVVGVSKIGHDVSQVRKLEAQLIEAQKMEAVGQLSAGVAHDFNNLLGIILAYGEIITRDLGAGHPVAKHLDSIRHAADRGAALTRQLLIFSRNETVQFEVLNLNEAVSDLQSMLRQLIDDNIDFSMVSAPDVGHIKADAGYLGQVLMNLVINARDAMPGGGTLSVVSANVTLDRDYLLSHPTVAAGDYVMIDVTDTGTGMTDAVKAQLFVPFFTTKPRGRGTGLGLATCRTIVQKCGGHIDVRSEVGQGTSFQVYFPRVPAPRRTAPRPVVVGPPPRGTELILIVEDDPDVRQLLGNALRSQGYLVLVAANGVEALRVVAEHKGPPLRLVISDVIMPRMGGQAMADSLQLNHPDLKILFTSGYTDAAIAHHGVLDPGVAFLAKPYGFSVLAHKVRDLLDQPAITPPAALA